MQIPVIVLVPYLELYGKQASPNKENLDPELKSLCDEVSRTLRETGDLSKIHGANDRFLDMMERFFEMPDDFKRRQERPQLHYQFSCSELIALQMLMVSLYRYGHVLPCRPSGVTLDIRKSSHKKLSK
ncbi:hypothetical protein PHJA_001545700 [Phtheirospermum japonicum]|uniref:eIF2D winged helix domain-containing protein n=1 Tax=Phtheirospermum japonicum TaxID=374723 RepID=A0A830CDB3_9LAMI|nr:hypothetical protein PHJA_001545700 [Phtheirospermum japonicum]